MTRYQRGWRYAAWAALALLAGVSGTGCSNGPGETPQGKRLSHEETLQWIAEHKAWRPAKKTRPIWARPLAPGEVGKDFRTADHATETAREGYWLCVGVAGEPWFQKPEKVAAKYDRAGEESKQFAFDDAPRTYSLYRPRGDVLNWAARVEGPGIEGFFIRPAYDMQNPLYSPAGGYVVKDHVADPYKDGTDDVWLVQEALFQSTYELLP
jgi:hypothetical protein